MPNLRNGTYLREPDGAAILYYSPFNFADASFNFRHRNACDGWEVVTNAPEAYELWLLASLQPGEHVLINGGEIVC